MQTEINKLEDPAALPEPLSPFLPGTNIQFAWDSTSLGWLKTCPRLYQYSMIDGWRARGDSVHLKFGQLYHSGLERYDRLRSSGQDHEYSLRDVVLWCMVATWEREECTHQSRVNDAGDCSDCMNTGYIGPGKPWESGHNLKTRETLIRSVIWYLEQFGPNDTCETVQLASGKPAVELSFRMEMDWGPRTLVKDADYPNQVIPTGSAQPYVLSGHLDRVVQFQGAYYVMDRKTSSTTIGSYYFDQYDPDNQMSLYSMAARVIYQTPVRGVIIDAAQIAVGFSRFSRGFTFRTEAQIEEWLENTKHWLALAEGYATEGFWPMNDRSCHQYGGCVFRKVCSKSPEVRHKFLETDFVKKQWNPLEVR
jgi:hypothetical protein